MLNVTPESHFDENLSAFQCLPAQTSKEDGWDLLDHLKEWVETEPVFCPVDGVKLVRFIVLSEYTNKPKVDGIHRNFETFKEVFFGDSKEVRALAANLIECAEWMEANSK